MIWYISLTGLKSRCQQGWFLLETLRNIHFFFFFFFPASRGFPHALACVFLLHVSNILSSLSYLLLLPLVFLHSSLRYLSLHWVHLSNSGQSLHLITLKLIPPAKSLCQCKVTESKPPGIRVWTSLEGHGSVYCTVIGKIPASNHVGSGHYTWCWSPARNNQRKGEGWGRLP